MELWQAALEEVALSGLEGQSCPQQTPETIPVFLFCHCVHFFPFNCGARVAGVPGKAITSLLPLLVGIPT